MSHDIQIDEVGHTVEKSRLFAANSNDAGMTVLWVRATGDHHLSCARGCRNEGGVGGHRQRQPGRSWSTRLRHGPTMLTTRPCW